METEATITRRALETTIGAAVLLSGYAAVVLAVRHILVPFLI